MSKVLIFLLVLMLYHGSTDEVNACERLLEKVGLEGYQVITRSVD